MNRAGRELEVQLLLDELRPVVVALSETEIPSDDMSVVFQNYKVYYPLPTSKGFRLLLLLREDYASRYNPSVLRSTTMEIWIKLETKFGPLAIGSIYRQWSGPQEEEDLGKIDDAIRVTSEEYDRMVVIGDMNLDLARSADPNYYRRRLLRLHLQCLKECGLEVANELDMSHTFVSYGTFENKDGPNSHKSSILDHVYYKGIPTPTFSVLPVAITDHRPTLSGFDLWRGSRSLKTVSRRNFKSISPSALILAINAESLSRVFGSEDVEEIHSIIIQEITAALDLVAPIEEVQIKEGRSPLYLTTETRAAIQERDRAATLGDHHVYRRLRNKAARLVRRDKLASNERHLLEQGFDPKAVWNLANASTGRSSSSTLPAELIDETGTRIREKIDAELLGKQGQQHQNQLHQDQEQQQQRGRFRFRVPNERMVHRTIMSLNNTSAIGVDGIPVAVLKLLAPVIAAPVAHLIRISFETSAIPSGFKRASVVPLHKKNKPPSSPASYRPVAILPALSKVLERVVLQQVSPHLAPLLPPTQFGFRPRRSTTTAIAYAHGTWAAARARGLVVAVAGYDLSSAFDTIDVDMVSVKLKGLGIVQEENRWFLDYLQGRKQQVQYKSARSSFRDIRHGVPQGSILGPLLFLALVADLPARVLATGAQDVEIGISAYADDAVCWAAGRDPEKVGDKLKEISDTIVNYATENYLALNAAKTQVLWTTSSSRPLQVGSSLVQPSNTLEVLGVTFDKQLTPHPHLLSLISSARSMAAMAKRLRLHLPTGSIKSVMEALLRGRLGYACSVLPPRFKAEDTSPSLMAKLQVNVNDVARAMIGAKRSDKIHTEDLLKESGLPSINRLVIYTIAMECWRALKLRDVPNGPMNPLGNLLSPPTAATSADNKPLRTRTRAENSGCIPPPARYQINSFTWWAYTCWNSSPLLRLAPTVSAATSASTELAAAAPI